MSDIVLDFKTFKNTKELSEYATAQFLALQSAVEKITELQKKVHHLEELLKSSQPIIGENSVERIIKSPELAIVEAQINLLTQRALTRELQLEEVKTLDILIRNKQLLSDQPTTIPGESKPKKKPSEAQLISIARITKKE